jgi:hypothetical protein
VYISSIDFWDNRGPMEDEMASVERNQVNLTSVVIQDYPAPLFDRQCWTA